MLWRQKMFCTWNVCVWTQHACDSGELYIYNVTCVHTHTHAFMHWWQAAMQAPPAHPGASAVHTRSQHQEQFTSSTKLSGWPRSNRWLSNQGTTAVHPEPQQLHSVFFLTLSELKMGEEMLSNDQLIPQIECSGRTFIDFQYSCVKAAALHWHLWQLTGFPIVSRRTYSILCLPIKTKQGKWRKWEKRTRWGKQIC